MVINCNGSGNLSPNLLLNIVPCLLSHAANLFWAVKHVGMGKQQHNVTARCVSVEAANYAKDGLLTRIEAVRYLLDNKKDVVSTLVLARQCSTVHIFHISDTTTRIHESRLIGHSQDNTIALLSLERIGGPVR